MTHADIITKFLIEYDKANITSSYPSLTEYEIATVLDKAYLALLGQKMTGNNVRKTAFEGDVKAIEDVRPLIKRIEIQREENDLYTASNEYTYTVPDDMLYFLDGYVNLYWKSKGLDKASHIGQSIILMPHVVAQKYRATSTNMPWIKEPIASIEGDRIYLLIDQYAYSKSQGTLDLTLIYLRKPAKFVNGDDVDKVSDFELNDSMAEELINLAIIMSLDVVESSRLNSKSQLSALES